MRVIIKSVVGDVPVDVRVAAYVAEVKLAYLESGRFPSDALRDFIALTWRGKQLADTKTLAECGVPAGATLHHVTYGIAAQAPVDYHAMVKSITADHGEQDPTEFPEHWDSKWSRGDEWMTYREFAGAL